MNVKSSWANAAARVRPTLAGLGLGRLNQILLAALAVQIVIALAVLWPRTASTASGQPLLAGLTAGDVVALTVAEPEGKQLTLRKVTGQWLLPEHADYAVQETKIAPVLDKLTRLNTARPVTNTADSHRRLKVAADDYLRRADIETADGKHVRLYLGSSPAYGATHVRVDGQNETYLTSDITTWELGTAPNTWIDTSYVEIPLKDVQLMTLQNAAGTLVLTQQAEGVWALEGLAEGETLDQGQADALVRRVASLRLDRPLGKQVEPAYGLDAPLAVATLRMADRT
ncbi:MAG: DUF4340 domain-containing protein, partial [Chloroflexota bacterium]